MTTEVDSEPDCNSQTSMILDDEDDEVFKRIVGTHKPGSLRSMKLKNFLTYRYVEVQFGPRLNMVCGPNGTGKSTILNAICLGLGGDPKVLGRADDVRAFITNGEDVSMIEITLEPFPRCRNRDDGDGEDEELECHTIRRVMDRNKGSERGRGRGASIFYINDKKVKQEEVKRLVHETYNIAVDNLCTFLPQDKVGNFSGFTPQDLLRETTKSLSASQHLYTTLQSLIDLEENYLRGNTDVTSLEDDLTKLKADHARLKREVERNEEREAALQQMQLLEWKKLWLEQDALRFAAQELKNAKDAAKKTVKAAREEKVLPLQQELEEGAQEEERLKGRWQRHEEAIGRHKREVEKLQKKVEVHNERTEEVLSKIQSCEAEYRNAERAVAEQQAKLESIQARLADQPSPEETKQEWQEARSAYNHVKPAFEQANETVNQIAGDLQQAAEQVNRLQSKIKSLDDKKKQRRANVFGKFPHLEKICEYIEQHRQDFRYPVFGPVALEITVKSNNAAAYLEQHVPNWSLKAFVVQSPEDYHRLFHEIREVQKIPINVVTVKPTVEPVQRMYTDSFMQELKQHHGVIGYLDEAVEGPPPVLQALIEAGSIHKVLVGTERTQNSIDANLVARLGEAGARNGRKAGSCIFSVRGHRSYKYTTSYSRHNGKEFQSSDEIGPARILAAGADPQARQATQKLLEDAQAEYTRIEENYGQAKEESHAATKATREAKDLVDRAREIHKKVQKNQSLLVHHQEKLERLEIALANINAQTEKGPLFVNLKNHIAAYLSSINGHAMSHSEMMEATIRASGLRVALSRIEANNGRTRALLHNAKTELNTVEQQYQRAHNDFVVARNKLKKAAALANQECPLEVVDEDGNKVDSPLKAQLEAIEATTVEEADAALEDAKNTVDSIAANPHVVEQYEKQQEEIEQLEAQLNSVAHEKETQVNKIDGMAQEWERGLSNSIHKVDSLFRSYMGELRCGGQIVLFKGEYEAPSRNAPKFGNFQKWGIEIKVKFRDAADLETLSAQRQSGGERAVSTIMYLMALQEMMVAPFRCVDEINQGLDERNERLVFSRIVKNSTRRPLNGHPQQHSGQYFLITPKLLPNLLDMENEGVTLLIIQNGPHNLAQQMELFSSRALLEMGPARQSGDRRSSDSIPRRRSRSVLREQDTNSHGENAEPADPLDDDEDETGSVSDAGTSRQKRKKRRSG